MKPNFVKNLLKKTVFFSLHIAILIILLAKIITTENIEKLTTSSKRESVEQELNEQGEQKSYNIPFLVLMSNQEISIAQLPLIDDGKVSVVYRITDNRNSIVTPKANEPSSESDSQEKLLIAQRNKIADAREYEQQMPSDGLRKFFSPPIVGLKTVAATSSSSSTSGRKNQEEVVGVKNSTSKGKEEEEEDGDEDGREGSQEGRGNVNRERRGTRSISENYYQESDFHHRHSPGTSNKRQHKQSFYQQEESKPRELESHKRGKGKENPMVGSLSLQATQSRVNVTSAYFEAASQRRKKRNSQDRSSPEDDAKNSDAEFVKFSDFDVHVALGYVFAADSSGRVHRFRLSGFSDREIVVISSDIDPEQPSVENDITNTINSDTNLPTTIPRVPAKPTSDVSFSERNSSSDGFGDGGAANKVSTTSSFIAASFASHEQFGQHPTVSGVKLSANEQASTSDKNSISYNASNNLTLRKQQSISQKLGELKSEEPKIIWSRFKHESLSSVATRISFETSPRKPSAVLSSKQQLAQLPVEGALPQPRAILNQTEPNAGKLAFSKSDDQLVRNSTVDHMDNIGTSLSMLNSTKKSSKLSDEIEDEQASVSLVNNFVDNCDDQLAPNFGTEIAVDWVNNVLFVLDKCRLVLVDFNGNNELVLIDDFDKNNRPVDIKVDPINGFLFWLQVGTFENTIYRLNTNAVADKYSSLEGVNLLTQIDRATGTSNNVGTNQHCNQGQLAALTSRHYAHPIIYVLPQHAKLFTIDHKHSRIYVPLAPSTDSNGTEQNKTTQHQDDAFVFDTENSNHVTHMNNTSCDDRDGTSECTTYDYNSTTALIRAYKLDGTDRGLFRGADGQIHLSDLNDLQDITVDGDKGLIYWLINGGKDLLEELGGDSYQTAQHNLEGKVYKKLIHFSESYQPTSTNLKPKLRKMIRTILSASARCRWIRNPSTTLDDVFNVEAPARLNIRLSASNESFVSGNVPIIILSITFLAVLSLYLMYAFIFQHNDTQSRISSRESSIDGRSSMRDSQVGGINVGRSLESGMIPKWMNRQTPNTSAREYGATPGRNANYDLESTNYHESNAIDEHYRDRTNSPSLSDTTVNRLANINEWPMNFNDMSNKLYVPVEVLQDDALASINRISIDQLEIERRNPLGEGNFGTVLQGVITCSINEKNLMLNKTLNMSNNGNLMDSPSYVPTLDAILHNRAPVPSSSSSGHGSSLISTEFVTANSCEVTSNEDYLTPKSNCQSNYQVNNIASSRPDSYSSYNIEHDSGDVVKTKFKVAIKRLKDNASLDEKRDFLQEAKLLANFDHPNIVQLIGICLDRGSTLIVMELMLGGDLIRYMQENIPKESNMEILTNEDLLTICLDIVNGCCYLEDLNYIHRDLAARNCLVSSRKKEERIVKLADFGLARDIYKDSYYKKLNDSAMPLKWMAPECLIEQKFTNMSDVWSFGVVMWEVMSYCKEKPYRDVEPIFMKDFLTRGGRLDKPDNCSDEIYMLMNECWQMDPKVRPTFQECRATLIEIKNSRRT